MDESPKQRRLLTQSSPLAWEHPADRAALNALRKLPGFGDSGEQFFFMLGVTLHSFYQRWNEVPTFLKLHIDRAKRVVRSIPPAHMAIV